MFNDFQGKILQGMVLLIVRHNLLAGCLANSYVS